MTLTTDLRHADFETLKATLRKLDAAKYDIVVPADTIRMRNGRLHVDQVIADDRVYPATVLDVTDQFLQGIAAKLDIPITYLRKLVAANNGRTVTDTFAGAPVYDKMSLLDVNVNYWLDELAGVEKNLFVRAYIDDDGRGVARALLSERFRVIDNIDMMAAIIEGIRETGVYAELDDCDLSENGMQATFSCPQMAFDGGPWTRNYTVKRGGHTFLSGNDRPLVFAGFRIRNNEVGRGLGEQIPMIKVEVCTNGATLNLFKKTVRHVGAVMEPGVVSARTERKYAELIKAQLADNIATFTDRGWVQARIDEINEQAAVELNAPTKAADHVIELFGLKAERDAILDSFGVAGMRTVGHLAHALTDVAINAESGDGQHEIESAAEKVLQMAGQLARIS